MIFYRLFQRVDHGVIREDRCIWRNEHQRTLASRYATAMRGTRARFIASHR
jgi:hypothetical protein